MLVSILQHKTNINSKSGNNKNEVMYLKRHIFFHRLLIFIISVTMILALTSCAQQKKPVPKTAKSAQDENKPPKELEELSKAVKKIEKSLMEMHERSKKPLFIQQEEIKKKSKEKAEEQGGQEQQQSGGGSSGGQQGGQSKQPSAVELVTPEAKEIEPQIEIQQMKKEIDQGNMTELDKMKEDAIKLHTQWNAFEAKAASKFVVQSAIVDFESSLDRFTKALEKDDVFDSLMNVIQLNKYLPDFYLAYTPDYPPEIDKIRFAAKKIQLLSEKDDYAGTKQILDYLSGVWMPARSKLNKESLDLINQFDFAASDLKKAIEAKDKVTIKAKTEVMLKIADELEKTNSKKNEKK